MFAEFTIGVCHFLQPSHELLGARCWIFFFYEGWPELVLYAPIEVGIARQVSNVKGQLKRSGLRIQFKVESITSFN